MRESLSPAALSNLIRSIYDCALAPERWPETLTALCLQLDFIIASLSLIEWPSGHTAFNIMVGSEPKWIETFSQYKAGAIAQWGGMEKLLKLPFDQPVVASQVSSPEAIQNTGFYAEWEKPQGISDGLAIFLVREPTMLGSLALSRHESAGEIGSLEIEAARLLTPHLQRAVAISKLLDLKSAVAATFETALDSFSVGVVLVNAELGIVHANAAGQAMLAAGDPIRSEHGIVSLRSPAAKALSLAVRQAAEDESAIGKRGFGIPSIRGNGEPFVLHVLPLKYGELRSRLAPEAVAAIFIAPAVPPIAPAEALAALFDLTPAEARVFAYIATGRTQAEIAQELQIEPGTVKTHLLRIFAKTGAKRQADLIKLAANLALPLRV